MAVECDHSEAVAYLHTVSIVGKRLCHHHNAGKGCPDAVVRTSLDVCSSVWPAIALSVWADDMSPWQGVAPVGRVEVFQVKDELGSTAVGVNSQCCRRVPATGRVLVENVAGLGRAHFPKWESGGDGVNEAEKRNVAGAGRTARGEEDGGNGLFTTETMQ